MPSYLSVYATWKPSKLHRKVHYESINLNFDIASHSIKLKMCKGYENSARTSKRDHLSLLGNERYVTIQG